MNHKPKVICIDDDRTVLSSMRRNLQPFSRDWALEFCATAQEGIQLLDTAPVTVVVTDWMMPEMDGLALCRHVRSRESENNNRFTYVIMLTGKDSTESVVEALEQGADDFLSKPVDMRELVARIRVGMRMLTLQQNLRDLNDQLARLAATDPLTGLFNRRRGEEMLEENLARVHREKQELSVILVDLDRFKAVNDCYGHEAGDLLLVEVARRIKKTCRRYDAGVRWGGDEMLLICPHATLAEALGIAERLRGSFAARPVEIGHDEPIPITASIGVASAARTAACSWKELIALADRALYEGKAAGRNCVRGAVVPQDVKEHEPAD